MKLTGILLLATILHVSARGTAQTVTLEAKRTSLSQVFAAIKQQTGCVFFYSIEDLVDATPVSVQLRNTPLKQALEAILSNQPLTFNIQGNTIAITRKGPTSVLQSGDTSLLPPPSTYINIHGRVLDEAGKPLVAVTVTVKGTKVATSTNENGEFVLKNTDKDATLVFSSVNMVPFEVRVNGRGDLLVNLKAKTSPLDEVQIIAYGTTTKRFNTGNISTVKAEDIAKQPISNPLAAMEGRVPGMFITQNTGVPGGGFNVQIRGQNSIANGNDPLYVIDGVPYTSTLLNSLGSNILGKSSNSNIGSPFNYINPSDIESIDVLKDADATAIYGSRGANGVVLITTKKGISGKHQVDINFYSGFGKVTRKMKMLNTQQYLQMRNEAFKNDNAEPSIANQDYDLLSWDTTRSTDWQKMFIGGTAHNTDAQASVSGGNTSTQYTIGGGYHRETTVFPGDYADQKGSVHFNLTSMSPDLKFKAVLSGSYVADNNNLPSVDATYVLNLPPDAPPVHNADGSLNWANSTWTNPFSYLVSTFKSNANSLVSNGILSYLLLPGLELKTSLGYTNMQVNQIATTPQISIDPASWSFVKSSSSFVNNNIRSWIVEPQITYQMILGKGKLNALVGTTIQQNTNQGSILDATGFTSDLLLQNIRAASSVSVSSSTNTQYKYNAVFGRINYNWEDKYLLNLTARRDGSSRFGPGKQFANFGAVGAGWIFSKESFIQNNLPFLSFGKLRVSYGTTGNDQIGDYRFLDLYNSYGVPRPYQGTSVLVPTNLFNPDFAWEINRKLEGGLELGLLKDRIFFSGSYYRNRSSNQLVGYPLPSVTGFTSIPAYNLPATIQNTGFELSLNTVNIKTKNFSWTSSINLTIARNKLIAYPNFSTSPYSNTLVVGQPLTITKAYHLAGVNDTTGIYQFADSKGNLTYSPANATDKTDIINTAPVYYGGLENSFNYKGFQLDVFFQFVKQTGINYLYDFLPGASLVNQPVTVLNRWQNPGDHKLIERFNQDYNLYDAYSYARLSNQAYSDASYIRLKNLSLSYELPGNWKHKIHVSNCRVYLQGQNLLTITHYIGYDPENQSPSNLPPLRMMTGGIRVTL